MFFFSCFLIFFYISFIMSIEEHDQYCSHFLLQITLFFSIVFIRLWLMFFPIICNKMCMWKKNQYYHYANRYIFVTKSNRLYLMILIHKEVCKGWVIHQCVPGTYNVYIYFPQPITIDALYSCRGLTGIFFLHTWFPTRRLLRYILRYIYI